MIAFLGLIVTYMLFLCVLLLISVIFVWKLVLL